MSKKSSTAGTILNNIIILAAGIVMIAGSRRTDFLTTIIFVTGIVFIFPAIINIFQLLRENGEKDEKGQPKRSGFARFASWLCCGAAIVLGLIMCINPGFFKPLYTLVFGTALILGGLFNLYMISFGIRRAKFPKWTYVLPALIVIGGVVVLAANLSESVIVLILGIGLIFFSVARFIEMIGRRTIARQDAQVASGDYNANQLANSTAIEKKD